MKFQLRESLCCLQLDINFASLLVRRPRKVETKLAGRDNELRILFAMTLALGIAAPTYSTDATTSHLSPGGFTLSPAIDQGGQAPEINQYEQLRLLASLTQGPRDEAASSAKEAIEETPAPPAKAEPANVPVERVCQAMAQAASDQGLPAGFFARLLWQESKFNQWARSAAGALGVAQFMPLTAAEYGLQNPFDPLQSVAASARFLRELRDQFGNIGLAAAAYNAGVGRIRKWLNGQSSLPEETRNYVQIITGHPAKRWTVQKPLQVSFALPGRAPCDGVEGLSRNTEVAPHEVRLTELSRDLIVAAAEARRAKIAAERAARAAHKKKFAAKSVKARRLAAHKAGRLAAHKGRKFATHNRRHLADAR